MADISLHGIKERTERLEYLQKKPPKVGHIIFALHYYDDSRQFRLPQETDLPTDIFYNLSLSPSEVAQAIVSLPYEGRAIKGEGLAYTLVNYKNYTERTNLDVAIMDLSRTNSSMYAALMSEILLLAQEQLSKEIFNTEARYQLDVAILRFIGMWTTEKIELDEVQTGIVRDFIMSLHPKILSTRYVKTPLEDGTNFQGNIDNLIDEYILPALQHQHGERAKELTKDLLTVEILQPQETDSDKSKQIYAARKAFIDHLQKKLAEKSITLD